MLRCREGNPLKESYGEALLLGAGATALFGAPALRGLRVER